MTIDWLQMNFRQVTSEKRFLGLRRGSHPQRSDERWDAELAIWSSVAQWLDRLNGHQKAAGSIPVSGAQKSFLWG